MDGALTSEIVASKGSCEVKSTRLVGNCLLGTAHLARERGGWSRAAGSLGASAAAFEKTRGALNPDYVVDRERRSTQTNSALGADAFEAEVAAEAGLDQEAAVRKALA